MFIAIYCSVIAAVCVALIAFFLIKFKKDKKNYEKLHNNLKMESKVSENDLEKEKESEEPKKEKNLPEKENEVIFEDFSLNEPQDENVEKKSRRNHGRVNFDEGDLDEDDDGKLDDKFAEYEEFLRKNLNLDDDEDDDDNEESDKLDEDVSNFNLRSLKGKSQSEIAEIIKSLPPKAQEILMSDVLTRKDLPDENSENDDEE